MRKVALAAWPYLLAALATIPVWIVKRLPIEDYPAHLAAIRIVHDLHDPTFGFEEHFVLALTRTQYVGYYALGHLLAYPIGVDGAQRLLACAWLGGAILALRVLLRALDRDERACLFAVPMLYGPLFLVGLMPFLIGLPLLFLVIAACVAQLERPTRRTAILLGALSLGLALWHVIPWALACVAVAAMGRRRIARLWPFAPSVLVVGLWLLVTDAGLQVRQSMLVPGRRLGMREAFLDAYTWIGDGWRDHADEMVFGALLVVVLWAAFVALRARRPMAPGYGLLPLACVVLYFALARDRGFIWPLAQRFPLMIAMLSIPLLGFPTGRAGKAMTATLAALGLASIALAAIHFRRVEREEVGQFDEALEVIGPRKKVAALIFDRHSSIVQYAPFLHWGSYYQAEKGGVVVFTFAGYNHWPIDFQPGKYPPPGGPMRPMWEWSPERVSPDDDLAPYFDYVLVRGNGFPESKRWARAWEGDRWSVYVRQ